MNKSFISDINLIQLIYLLSHNALSLIRCKGSVFLEHTQQILTKNLKLFSPIMDNRISKCDHFPKNVFQKNLKFQAMHQKKRSLNHEQPLSNKTT